MSEIIVTSGQPFTDIDALACAIAYNELLNLEGKRAQTVLPGPLNNSITKKVKEWKLDFRVKPSTNKAEYVLVDVSEPKFFANFVKKDLKAWRPEGSTESVVFEDEVKNLNFDSFVNWSLDDKNLILYFDKYQIGPGALGAVAFSLKLEKIKNYLEPVFY